MPYAGARRNSSRAHRLTGAAGPTRPGRAMRARRATRSRRSRSPACCASCCTAFERYSWKVMARPPANDYARPVRPALALMLAEQESCPEIHPPHRRITF